MEIFIIDGAKDNFADIIISKLIFGKKCSVASYGFGVSQVDRLISAFDEVLLIADESHSQLNPIAYKNVIKRDAELDCFTFRPSKIHAKFALIDDEIIIFTSANLSANRRIESYMIGQFNEVIGIDKIKKLIEKPNNILKSSIKGNSIVDIKLDKITVESKLQTNFNFTE